MANEVRITVTGENRAGGAFQQAEGQARGLGSALKNVAAIAAGVLAAQAIPQLVGQVGSIITQASALEESLSKVNVVFGESAGGITDWAAEAAAAFGSSKQQALEAVGTYGNLFQAFGVGRDESATMSKSLVELATDLASFNNTPVDEALLALRSGLSGEAEPLKRFGIAIQDTRLKTEALAMGLIKTETEALTPGAKAQAAYALIMKDSTLAQGDFARTSGGLANQQRILSAQFTDLKGRIGTALLPAVTKVVSFLNDNMFPAFDKIGATLSPLAGAFKAAFSGEGVTSDGLVGVAERVGVGLKALVDFVREHWPLIKQVVTEVFDALRARAKLAFEMLLTVVEAVGPPLLRLFEQLATSVGPVVLNVLRRLNELFDELAPTVLEIVQNVAELVGALIDWAVESGLVDTVMAGIKTTLDVLMPVLETLVKVVAEVIQFMTEHKSILMAVAIALGIVLIALNPIPAAILGVILVVGLLKEHWREMVDFVVETALWVKDQVVEKFNALKDLVLGIFETVKTFVVEKAFALKDGVVQKFQELVGWVSGLSGLILGALGDLGGLLFGAGLSLIQGLWNGIKDLWNREVAGWLNIGSKVKAAVGDLSRLLFGVGLDILQGLWNGLKDKWDQVSGWVGSLGGKIKDLKGPNDARLLTPAGLAIMESLSAGLQSGWGPVMSFLASRGPEVEGVMHKVAEAAKGGARPGGAGGLVGGGLGGGGPMASINEWGRKWFSGTKVGHFIGGDPHDWRNWSGEDVGHLLQATPPPPQLQGGGRISGAPSRGVLALLHGQEEVLNPRQQAQLRRRFGGSGEGAMVVHIHGNVILEGDPRAGLAALALEGVA